MAFSRFVSSTSSDDSSDSETDDIAYCTVCYMRYDSSDYKPKYLDCHHYFCIECIKGFSKRYEISCPKCRYVTKMSGRLIENLTTNNDVLRFINMSVDGNKSRKKTHVQRDQRNAADAAAGDPLKQNWCVDCSTTSSSNCKTKRHYLCTLADFFMESNYLLEQKATACCQAYDEAINDRQRTSRVYEGVLASLELLQHNVEDRLRINTHHATILAGKKQSASEIAVDSQRRTRADDVTGDKVDEKLFELKNKEAQLCSMAEDADDCRATARRLVQQLGTIEKNVAHFSSVHRHLDSQPFRVDEHVDSELHKSLQGVKQPEPGIKACISILSYLVSISGDAIAPVLKSLSLANWQQPQPSNFDPAVFRDKTAVGRPSNEPIEFGTGILPSIVASSSSSSSSSSVDSPGILRDKVVSGKPPDEPTIVSDRILPSTTASSSSLPSSAGSAGTFRDKVVSGKPPDGFTVFVAKSRQPSSRDTRAGKDGKKCYLFINIDGVRQAKVVIELDPQTPIMSEKFIEMCTSDKGYRGSPVFIDLKNREAVYGKPRCLSDDCFTADKSEVKEKRGSIRFHVQDIKDWKARVTTDFAIILKNRPNFHKFTTVFGHVTEGLDVLDRVSEMDTRKCRVLIAECGSC